MPGMNGHQQHGVPPVPGGDSWQQHPYSPPLGSAAGYGGAMMKPPGQQPFPAGPPPTNSMNGAQQNGADFQHPPHPNQAPFHQQPPPSQPGAPKPNAQFKSPEQDGAPLTAPSLNGPPPSQFPTNPTTSAHPPQQRPQGGMPQQQVQPQPNTASNYNNSAGFSGVPPAPGVPPTPVSHIPPRTSMPTGHPQPPLPPSSAHQPPSAAPGEPSARQGHDGMMPPQQAQQGMMPPSLQGAHGMMVPPQPRMTPQQQQPGMMSQQQQQSGMPPQQQHQHPGMPSQQQHPGMMSQQQQPGMPPHQQQSGMMPPLQQQPGAMPPQQQQPGGMMPQQQRGMMPPTPGAPPQQRMQQQQPAGMRPPAPPQPGMMPQQRMMPPQPGMTPPQHGGMPPQPGMMPPQPGGMPSQPGMMPPQPGMMPPQPGGMPPQPGMMPSQPGMMPQQTGGGRPQVGGMPQQQMPGGGMPMQPGGMPMGGMQPGQGAPPKQRLDAALMPSQVQVLEDDRKSRTGLFQTGLPTAEVPPLVTTDFYCEDQGNCNPSLMRATMYCAPANSDLLKNSALPFGVCISPMAEHHVNEYAPPVVDLGAVGPIRCQRCKAYMCPFMEFQDGGRRFRCPFCRSSSEVPQEYFAHLDQQGKRTDLYQRPELFLGAYEFVATPLYCKNGLIPKEPAFIFMLDVSYNSVNSGLVKLLCQNIKRILRKLPIDYNCEKSVMKVGFATYDQSIHFYNLKNSLDQPQMMIVGDVNEVFVPMVDGFLVTVDEAECAIDSLLQEIPTMFGQSRITETCLGPVVQAGMDALKAADRSGKLFIFHSALPVMEAPGRLKNRDDRKLLGTDKEKTVLVPQTDFYSKLAAECVTNGCCVDVFLFPNSYTDVATIADMCTTTGGSVYKYQYFEAAKDGQRFLGDLQRDVERPIAFDAMMRVRTSTGIRPTGFWGSFLMTNTTDIEVAAIDSDKAITIEIKHDDKLDEGNAYIQTALLFTSVGGQRRLRILNMALPVASDYNTLYRVADQDTVVNFLAKLAENMVRDKSPKDIRENLSGRCAQILATYREKCSESAPTGQLILPECLKLLPLYTNCIVKHDALAGGTDITTDDRSWTMHLVPSLRVQDGVSFFYPRIVAVTALTAAQPANDTGDGTTTGGDVEIPTAVRCSYDNLNEREAYLIENGILMFLWVGIGTPQDWVRDVFGCDAVTQIDTEKQILPEKDNERSRMLRKLIEKLHHTKPRRMKLFIIRKGDALEPWMKKFLVEDRSGSGTNASYVDFLCFIHREIRSILS